MMGTSINHLRWGMGTATGPGHLKTGKPNQDACAVFASDQIVAAAVADGLGSRPFSHQGARWAVTLAVTLAVDHLLSAPSTLSPQLQLEELKAKLLLAWRGRFGDKYPDYDCTLLLAALTDERAVLGQIGDGLILTQACDGTCGAFAQSDKPFQNVTDSLGHREALRRFQVGELVGPSRASLGALLMMTDGVADDLHDPDAFCRQSLDTLRQAEGTGWGETIRSWLQAWPRPGHSDDKTLLVISLAEDSHPALGLPQLMSATTPGTRQAARPVEFMDLHHGSGGADERKVRAVGGFKGLPILLGRAAGKLGSSLSRFAGHRKRGGRRGQAR